jgi:hypothetical protein
VNNLFGVYDCRNNRVIALKQYWDIQVDELEEQEYARIILSGDRQALLGRRGDIKSMFPSVKNGKPALAPATYIGPFINGLARINIGGTFVYGSDLKDKDRFTFSSHSLSASEGKWGYVNGRGELYIKAELEYASDFFEGKAIVKKEGYYGVIDSLGQYIIKPEYSYISYLENSDKKFFKLIKNKSECGLINDRGRVILKAEYNSAHGWNENRVPLSKGDVWGACDYSGKMVIPFRYEYLGLFYEGRASFKEKNKWGYIDTLGNAAISPAYTEVRDFKDGLAAVKMKSYWGFIDHSGNMVIPAKFNKVSSFENGTAAVYLKKKWWYINHTGKKISSHKFNKAGEFNKQGLAIVIKNKRYYVYKSTGRLITHAKYKKIFPYSEGLAKVKGKKNKYGFIDTTGKLIVPLIYSNASDFHEGLACVRYPNGKWGYINKKNVVKIEAEYRKGEDFSEGRAAVILKKSTIVIDSQGVQLFDLPEQTLGKYKEGLLLINGTYYNQQGLKEMGKFTSASPFSNGIAKVRIGGNRENNDRLITKKNNQIATYPSISEVKEHLACFFIYQRIGLADSDGKIISPPIYQNMNYYGEGIFQVTLFDEVGYMNKSGKWIWKPAR